MVTWPYRMKAIATGATKRIQMLKKEYRPSFMVFPSKLTSLRMTLGPMTQPTKIDMTKAPRGMATPSEIKSMKSSQVPPRVIPVSWKGIQSPLEPSPSAATITASASTMRQAIATILLRLGDLPLAT